MKYIYIKKIMNNSSKIFCIGMLICTIGCSDTNPSFSNILNGRQKLVRIEITPHSLTIGETSDQKLTVTGHYEDGVSVDIKELVDFFNKPGVMPFCCPSK